MKNAGKYGDRQNEIRNRAGRDYCGAGADGFENEAVLLFGFGHGVGSLTVGHAGRIVVAEEFHIAAERNRGDLPARAVTVVETAISGPNPIEKTTTLMPHQRATRNGQAHERTRQLSAQTGTAPGSQQGRHRTRSSPP